MSVVLLVLLLTASVFLLSRELSAQETCSLDATLTIANELDLHFLFRGDRIYQISVDSASARLYLVNSSLIRDHHYFTQWQGTRVTRSWTWRSSSRYPQHYQAVIGDHQSSTYIRVLRTDGTLEHMSSQQGDSLGNLFDSTTAEDRAFFYSTHEPGYAFVNHQSESQDYQHSIIVSINITNNDEVRFNLVADEELNDGNPQRNEMFDANFMNFTRVMPVGVLLIGLSSPNSQHVVVFARIRGRIHHCFGDVFSPARCTQPFQFQVTDPNLFGGCQNQPATPPPGPSNSTDSASNTSATLTTVPIEVGEQSGNGLSFLVIILAVIGVLIIIAICVIWYFRSAFEKSEVELEKVKRWKEESAKDGSCQVKNERAAEKETEKDAEKKKEGAEKKGSSEKKGSDEKKESV